MAISEPTVFIVGAGASKPYGLPTGIELTEKIRANHHNLEYALRGQYGTNYEEQCVSTATKFSSELWKSGSRSVDRFLEDRPDLREPGILAIAAELLPAEQKARNDFKLSEHWITILFDKMRAKPDQFGCSNNVKFIIFNYDRLIELFLVEMLQFTFGCQASEARDSVRSIDFLHVYGELDHVLEFDTLSVDPTGAIIRSVPNNEAIAKSSCGIRIISDERAGNDVSSNFEKAKQWITSWAKNIYILGFGFDHVNCERLGFYTNDWIRQHRGIINVFSTFYGMNTRQVEIALRRLSMRPRPGAKAKGIHNSAAIARYGENEYSCASLLNDWL